MCENIISFATLDASAQE